MAPRPCQKCGTPTTTTRCPTCEQAHQAHRNTSRPHLQGNWTKLSKQLRTAHVAQHGWTCPGFNTPPHPSTDLTVDHINPRNPTALQVLCRPCNSRKSATEHTTHPTA